MKTRFYLVNIFIVLISICDHAPAAAQVVARTNLRITEGRYLLRLSSGRVMEADANGFRSNGARVQIWLPYYALNQLWDFKDAGEGKYFIINVGSNRALQAVRGSGLVNGSAVQLWPQSATSEEQKWYVQSAGTGKYTFRCAAAGSDKVLDVTGAVIDRGGAPIQLWDNRSGPNQSWTMVRSFDSAVVRNGLVDLRLNQSALKHQAPVMERGSCTFFGNIAALEAAYKKRGYGELDLSEEFFATMAKILYIHPYWSDNTGANYRENQFGGLQGGGSIDWFKNGLRLPLESNMPFKTTFDVPRYWDTLNQRVTSDFNATLLTAAMLKAPLFYGATAGEKIVSSLQRNTTEYERILSFGYEIDVDLNIAHNYLVVGFDKTDAANPVFLVKDSYETPGTRCFSDCNRVPYATLMGMVDGAGYITEVRAPGSFPELAFLGTWKLNFDGHRGRLDIYHIPGITNPGLLTSNGGSAIADKRIGVFYDETGRAFRVNGAITGNKIEFYFDLSTPNQRWDEMRGRKFGYYLNPALDIMTGFHMDADRSNYAGYATKGNYIVHGTADPFLDRLVNNNWTMKWGNKSGTVRCSVGEDGTRVSGTFTSPGATTERITFSYNPTDHSFIKVTMGTSIGSMKYLSHERGIMCGADNTGNIMLFYKQ
jgi:Ricin-type beta-trefoil lectin domain-like